MAIAIALFAVGGTACELDEPGTPTAPVVSARDDLSGTTDSTGSPIAASTSLASAAVDVSRTTASDPVETSAPVAQPTSLAASAATEPPTTPTAPVTLPVAVVSEVTDGDTVVLDGGTRVRLIGIDAPESGSCEATAAAWALAALVSGRSVTLTPGRDGDDVDRYGRLLRYVDVNGVDAGLQLVHDGLAIARFDSRDGYGRHDREDAYVAADETSLAYLCPPPPTTPPQIAPIAAPIPAPPAAAADMYYENCDAARAAGAAPIYSGEPGYRRKLDRDGDGVACE